MSTENASQTDFDSEGANESRTRAEFGGARYTGRDDAPRHRPQNAGECRNCGNDVPTEVQRVVGDNHGRVDACIECYVGQNDRTVTRWYVAVSKAKADDGWPARVGGFDNE